MIAPRGHQHAAAQFDDAARPLARRMHHAQRAAQLAVPRHERMHRRAAIHPLEAVIRALDDVQQAARRTAAGVVVHGEQLAVLAREQAEGIPKTARDATEAGAVRAAAEDAAFAPARELRAVAAGEGPVLPEVLAVRKHQVAIGQPCHAGQAVVRIVGDSVQHGDVLRHVRHAIAVRVLHAQDAAALGEINPTAGAELEVHRHVRLVVKDAAVLPVAVEDQHLVVLRSGVALRAEMRVARHGPDAALRVHVNARGRDQCGMFGEERELHAWLEQLDVRRQLGGDFRGHGRRGGEEGEWEGKRGEENGGFEVSHRFQLRKQGFA